MIERAPDGTPRRLVGVITDITRRKEAEQESEQRAERLELAASAAALGVWDQDLRTNRSTWDARMRTLYGLPPDMADESIDKDLMARLCHPDDLVRLRDGIHTALAGADHFDGRRLSRGRIHDL